MKPLQFIAHNDNTGAQRFAIWGYGDTPENAINHALEEYSNQNDPSDLDDLKTCQASPELIALVEENGGDIPWDYQYGIAIPT